MSTSKKDIENLVNASKKILIGIGEEFSSEAITYESSNAFKIFKEKRIKEKNNDEVDWMLATIKNNYFKNEINIEDLQIGKAYRELFNLVKEKDYFIVNMNADGLLDKVGFIDQNIVNPCGTHTLYQCRNNCCNKVIDADPIDEVLIQMICDDQSMLAEIIRPKCKKCGETLVYNTVENSNYCEEGYLDRWKNYTQWSSHTLNQELCVLELGVNFKYPTVIRWPFEKIAFINNKAHFVRINEKFNQTSSELSNKAITIKESAITFLLS